MRDSKSYSLFENQGANATSSKKISVSDFRHLGATIAWSAAVFTWTVKIKWSRVANAEDIDFTAAASQSNPWSYIQLINNEDWSIIEGSTGVVIAAVANSITNVAVNVDGFNYISAELSWYTAGDVNVDVSLYDND